MASRVPYLFLSVSLAAAAACSDDDSPPSDLTPDSIFYPDSTSDAGDVGPDASDTSGDTSSGAWRLTVEQGPGGGVLDTVFADCLYASPLVYESASRGTELVVTGGDVIVGLDPETGDQRWVVELEDEAPSRAFAAATPAIHDGLLVVGYALRSVDEAGTTLDPDSTGADAGFTRDSHWLAVVDLERTELDQRFAPVELTATVPGNDGEDVEFLPNHGFLRSEIGWWGQTDDSLGLAYATFGNVRDLQPWHGWAFEVDLDAWAAGETAISGVFNTTPETACGATNSSGSFQRVCGGGLWSPSGSIAVPADNERGFDVILAPGNGQLDLNRNDFANTLLRVPPGLELETGCDETLCADFDSDAPSHACIESCDRVFVPRLLDDEGPIVMEDGRCDGLEFFECWAEADFIGGSTPLLTEAPGGESVLVYPTKDGHVYLVDAEHLGTMYDREQLVAYCGTEDDACRWTWSGMIVSKPVQTTNGAQPRILVPTFMPDSTHPAGVVALRLVDGPDGPALERDWEFPNFSSEAAVERFRRHPSRIALTVFNDVEFAIVVDTAPAFQQATVYILRAATGDLVAEVPLDGPGYRFTQPAVVGDTVFFNSCDSDNGAGRIETLRLVAESVDQ